MQYGCINLTLINLKVQFITFINSAQATALFFLIHTLKVQFITFINSAQATALFFLIHTLDPLLKQGADKNKTFF